MMGSTHALTGVAGGCLLAGAVPAAPGPVRAVALVLVVVGSLAPDIDSERATITRALWLPGRLAHELAVAGGRLAFRLTATRYDSDPWNDGHRLITHTALAALAAGTVVSAGTVAAGRVVTAVLPTTGIWGGLLGDIGPGIVAAWWLWGLAFAWGCLVHILADTCTVQGTPLLWPLKIHGKRWWLVRAPLTVRVGGGDTGDGEPRRNDEARYVVPLASAMVVASGFWMVGLWGPIFSMIGWMVGRVVG